MTINNLDFYWDVTSNETGWYNSISDCINASLQEAIINSYDTSISSDKMKKLLKLWDFSNDNDKLEKEIVVSAEASTHICDLVAVPNIGSNFKHLTELIESHEYWMGCNSDINCFINDRPLKEDDYHYSGYRETVIYVLLFIADGIQLDYLLNYVKGHTGYDVNIKGTISKQSKVAQLVKAHILDMPDWKERIDAVCTGQLQLMSF